LWYSPTGETTDGTWIFNEEINLEVDGDWRDTAEASSLYDFQYESASCYLKFYIYENDGEQGNQEGSAIIPCDFTEGSIGYLQFLANNDKDDGQAMDHPNVAFAYKIEAKSSEYDSYDGEEEEQFRWNDLCGVYVFGWGFFCDFSHFE
jgi:hypothetical protein